MIVFTDRIIIKFSFLIEYQPRVRGWLLGTVDGKSQGIMPANYLKILGKKSGENVKTE